MSQAKAAKTEAASSERIHALDALRATMLSFVVMFHGVLSYTVRPSPMWPFKDSATTVIADAVVTFVHIFTLPTFFILAGFFSALLYLRRGPEEFTHNRALRIALPFAVGWLVLHPVVSAGFRFAAAAKGASVYEGFAAVQTALMDGSIFFPDSAMHLWFMYNLIFYYAVILAVVPLILCLPAAWLESARAAFAFIVGRPLLRLVVLTPITIGMLWTVGGSLYASLSFIPNLLLFAAYGFYFGFGWLLYLARDQIHGFSRLAWTQVLLGLAILVLIRPVLAIAFAGPVARAIFLASIPIVGGLLLWMFFFGLTGLYLRYFNRPSAMVRYLVDASFWIYLIHFPLAVWLPALLLGVSLPALIKILIVLSITYVLAIVTYDLFVRSTIIGYVLSGARRPRVLFGAADAVTSVQTAR